MKKKTNNQIPTISVITPTFNQGAFIEQTIQSVLSQNYPYLEYIVVDAGSTDTTLSILAKYKNSLHYISEPDYGQSDAINKGLAIATGDIVAFINSDDYLHPGCLKTVANFFSAHPRARWVTGKCSIVDESKKEVRRSVTGYKNFFLRFLRYFSVFCIVQFISQPATFWRKSVVADIGQFDVSLRYDMDYDYWLRIWKKYPLYYIDSYLASYRVHSQSKAIMSPQTQFQAEHDILKRYTDSPVVLFLHLLHVRFALFLYRLLWVK